MNIVSLFGGIECGYKAFKNLGLQVDNYYSSEINSYAIAIAKYNHPDLKELEDITKLTETELSKLPKIDWLIGGSPCQSFSTAGKQEGFNGKSGLFYEYLRVLKFIREYNNPDVKFLLENVRMKKEWRNQISESLLDICENVSMTSINSSLVSAQNRPRLYWTNFSVFQPEDKKILIKDILDIPNRESFKPSLKALNGKLLSNYQDRQPNIVTDKCGCLTIGGDIKCYSNEYYYELKNKGITKLDIDSEKLLELYNFSPIEYERLQTLPDDYTKYGMFEGVTKEISNTQRYKTLSNGWTVKVIEHIIKEGSI